MRSYFCFNRIFAGVIALLLMATIFYACTKTSNDVAPNDPVDNQSISAAADQVLVSSLYNDLFTIAAQISVDLSYSNAGGRKAGTFTPSGKLGLCYTPTVDDATFDRWPKVITVDFGTGCPDDAGRVRSGILKITQTGYFRYPGTTITIEPVTYKVNGVGLTGTKLITNIGTNSAYKYTAVVSGATVQLDTISVKYGGKMTITQLEGAGTNKNGNEMADDVFSYVGADSLVYPTGDKAITTVGDSSALIRSYACPHITKGKAILTLKDITATIDYGNGVCDDSVLISLGNKVKNVGLPK